MGHEAWGDVPEAATHFQVQRVTREGRRQETIEIASPQGDRSKWAPIASLTRDFLVGLTGGGRLRLFYKVPGMKGGPSSPVFVLGELRDEDEQHGHPAPAPAPAPVAAPPTREPASAWEMLTAITSIVDRRSDAEAARYRAEADARAKSAETNAALLVQLQSNAFVQMEKIRAEAEQRANRTDPAIAQALAGIGEALKTLGRRMDRLEERDEDDEEDDEADGELAPGVGEMMQLFDLYDPETGEIDWKRAIKVLGSQELVDQAKAAWPFLKQKFAEMGAPGKRAAVPTPQ